MIDLKKLTRQNIQALKPYSSARDEFSGTEGVFLDANENPYGNLNRYPDPYQYKLKEKISTYKGIDTSSIFIGNGSDEIIDLVFRVFCNPGIDQALTFTPTYGMYDVCAAINSVELLKVELDETFNIDLPALLPLLNNPSLKLILICSPNNPTGNLLNTETIEQIIETVNGIVLIDEAYIDFSDNPSFMEKIGTYPNLIVSQTLSKAWGLAGARIGIAYANNEIITLLNKVKPPYNVSELNQQAAIEVISNQSNFEKNKALILSEKEALIYALKEITLVQRIYPSDANFLLIEVLDADQVYKLLISQNLVVRNRNTVLQNCLRITLGTPEENQLLIKTLQTLEL
jgi:histidinol-phosphate aminotransferase